ncbi:unnamed protein product [Fusarium graminearum]|uniref:Chromosome 4, complete genome n=1 Tax=Gibberella zeae (strain ATCC MYA-4620 / CBS 123657 / FGSC 9075 / NRRL 31084 / PH-1) TaxID=229533 RepID=A0A098DXT4_GIBZE|nr:unnamed protein product [Fusarium graminearum]CZS72095.1 unnamed protein product [Fusarium graminearum]
MVGDHRSSRSLTLRDAHHQLVTPQLTVYMKVHDSHCFKCILIYPHDNDAGVLRETG